MKSMILAIVFLGVLPAALPAQIAELEPTIRDESLVPVYTLPDPLVMEGGTPVTEAAQWPARRAELVNLFEQHFYGRAPEGPVELESRVVWEDPEALDGRATLKEVKLVLKHSGKSLSIDVLVLIPNHLDHPAPAFLGLNFRGNHTVCSDARISLPQSWVPENEKLGTSGNKASEVGRGTRSERWPVELIISRGYALVTAYCGDIDPDFDDGFLNGAHGLFTDADFDVPAAERWGTLAAWAWGLSRILDCIQSVPAIDGSKVVVIGHSRLGKAAVWAGAIDERFAGIVSNNSGCGGVALSRRRFGERIANMNQRFPHWLNQRNKAYNEREGDLPIDQHELIALMAPRPVYVASATLDKWADPKGEFLSLVNARPVYQLLGIQTFPDQDQPGPGQLITGPLSYHIREGKHDILPEDWQHYLDFADRQVK